MASDVVSGEESAKSTPLLQEVPRDDFPQLVQILNEFAPASLCAQGYILQTLRSKLLFDCRVYVDVWPGTPEVVILEFLTYRRVENATLLPICGFARCHKLKLKQIITCDPHLSLHFSGNEPSEFHGCSFNFLELGREVPGSVVNISAAPRVCALLDPSKLTKCNHPDGYQLASLKIEDVPLIDKTWDFGGNDLVFKRLTNLTENSITAGMYKDGELVAWVLLFEYGALGALHTLPPHRGKGLARALIYHVSQKLLSMGRAPYCFILEENEASQNLFRKMGFEYYRNFGIAFFEIFPEANS